MEAKELAKHVFFFYILCVLFFAFSFASQTTPRDFLQNNSAHISVERKAYNIHLSEILVCESPLLGGCSSVGISHLKNIVCP